MIIILTALLISFLLALLLMLVLMPMAQRVGLVDHPDTRRKLHQSAIPMVGGLALFITSTLTTWGVILIGVVYSGTFEQLTLAADQWISISRIRSQIAMRPDDTLELVGLLLGATVLMMVGLADDRFGLRGRQKLLGQFFATTILILFGYRFESVMFAGVELEFGIFSVLVIYLWIIAAINSVNLLDGADGVAATIGIVMSLAICTMSALTGKMVDAVVSASIAGALFGFLKFNFPPAKAYLGDSGSMLIGFLLGALAIRCMFKQNSAYAFFAPVALLAIPFIDSGAAVIRRRMMGRSIFAVDRGHLHHALMRRGYSPRVSLLWVALLCTTTAAGGVFSLLYHQSEYALVSIGIVLVVMMACKVFGVGELQLVSRKAKTFAQALVGKASANEANILQSTVHVQGNRDWQEVWKLVCDFAEEHQLNEITMDLNAPWLHESFHATRKRSDVKRGECSEWFALVPLVADGRAFGRIEIHGAFDGNFSYHDVIRNVLKVTEDIEKSVIDPMLETPPASTESDSPAHGEPLNTPV